MAGIHNLPHFNSLKSNIRVPGSDPNKTLGVNADASFNLGELGSFILAGESIAEEERSYYFPAGVVTSSGITPYLFNNIAFPGIEGTTFKSMSREFCLLFSATFEKLSSPAQKF